MGNVYYYIQHATYYDVVLINESGSCNTNMGLLSTNTQGGTMRARNSMRATRCSFFVMLFAL